MKPNAVDNHHGTSSYFWGGLLIGLVATLRLVELEERRRENQKSNMFSWPRLFAAKKGVR